MRQPIEMSWPPLTAIALVLTLAGLSPAESRALVQDDGKIPITTASAEAKQQFLQGRRLAENLRAEAARASLLRAVTLDPGFALAHYNLATSAPTAKDFFDHLQHAVALAEKVSLGERLMIRGLEAGANANPKKQLELYRELVAKYPRDERAHFLLGGNYFGQQDYPNAITEYQKSIALAPDYAPAYNILGYAHRQVGDYAGAEKDFKQYIAIIPTDPNPYDSYAELLLKMGRFDESIAMYRKALSADPAFAASHIGIASALLFQGKPDASRAEAQTMLGKARNDGERRGALFTIAVAYADEGKFDYALRELEREYAVAERINDAASMGADRVAMGDVLLESGKAEEARKQYEQALQIQLASNLSREVKETGQLLHHYNLARAAVRQNDLDSARREAEALMLGATARQNAFQIRLAHEVAGTIALGEKDYPRAIAELSQANQQDPYNVYRLGLAYRGKGDQAKANEMFQAAANSNTLPTLNYVFIRVKAGRARV